MLRPQPALLVALIVHELATNATKYGALSVTGGGVDITWKIESGSPPHLELTWTERGGPSVETLDKRGFGMELIERGLRFEVNGDAKFEVVDEGLQCRMIIPADPERIIFPSPAEWSEKKDESDAF